MDVLFIDQCRSELAETVQKTRPVNWLKNKESQVSHVF